MVNQKDGKDNRSKSVNPHDSVSISKRSIQSILEDTGTNPGKGLTSEESRKQLSIYGSNKPVETRRHGLLWLALQQIREPMILILVIIAAIYAFIGKPEDIITIIVIIVIIIATETYTVNRARKSLDALRKFASPTCMAVRDGKQKEITTADIVPGDILLIAAGDRVAADARLIEDYGLKIDESSLTGESFPVIKDSEKIPTSSAVADLNNMIFSGTLIIQGSGRAVVTATGKSTEIGKITQLLENQEIEKTPLTRAMNKIIIILAFIAVFFSIFIPLIGYIRGFGLKSMMLIGLSLAFAIVPEELPVVISLTFARGAYTLTRKNVIVKNLKATEILGNVTVIATDKTGTLTENKMSVSHTYDLDSGVRNSNFYNKFLSESALLATGNLIGGREAALGHRDPMEVAVYK